jgi:hypothetical protein
MISNSEFTDGSLEGYRVPDDITGRVRSDGIFPGKLTVKISLTDFRTAITTWPAVVVS